VIATRPLHRFFGAIVEGVDVTKRISDETFAQLHNALTEFSVLVFPGQNINDAEQINSYEQGGRGLLLQCRTDPSYPCLVHSPTVAVCIIRLTPMQDTSIVPDQKISDLPTVSTYIFRPSRLSS